MSLFASSRWRCSRIAILADGRNGATQERIGQARQCGRHGASLSSRDPFVSNQRARAGTQDHLATAAEISMAKKVADHLGVFDEVYATQRRPKSAGQSQGRPAASKNWRIRLRYIGDSPADVPVWKSSRAAHVVGSQRLVRKAQAVAHVESVFDSQPATLQTWLSALRIHHWVKNTLLFLPLLLAHKFEWDALRDTTFGFLLFGLCASSIYIVNDLLDLHSDRAHPWKSKRPVRFRQNVHSQRTVDLRRCWPRRRFALGFLLNPQFGLVLLLYILTTFLYSVYLKRIVLLDVFVLSSFYVIRIWAGALVASVPLSDWFWLFRSSSF